MSLFAWIWIALAAVLALFVLVVRRALEPAEHVRMPVDETA